MSIGLEAIQICLASLLILPAGSGAAQVFCYGPERLFEDVWMQQGGCLLKSDRSFHPEFCYNILEVRSGAFNPPVFKAAGYEKNDTAQQEE